jgi:mannose-6-phosphate isomerase-like protein (cupin superfamily)
LIVNRINDSKKAVNRKAVDGFLLEMTHSFFTFHKKKAVIQGIRFASAFFGKGQFSSETMEQKDGKYILSSSLEGPYYQPLPVEHLPDDGDWEKMPRTLRPQSEVQKYTATVSIGEIAGGFELEIDIKGTDHVPLALELIFRPGGSFSGVEDHPDMKDVYYLKEGSGSYTVDGESIHFGPGIHTHKWVEIRGALPRMNAPTVFITGFTPFHHKMRIT